MEMKRIHETRCHREAAAAAAHCWNFHRMRESKDSVSFKLTWTTLFIVTTFYSLCITTPVIPTVDAGTAGQQQHQPQHPGSGLVSLHSTSPQIPAQNAPLDTASGSLPAAVTFTVTASSHTSLPTSPVPNFNHEQGIDQPTTKRPIALASVATTVPPQSSTTTSMVQPSSLSSMIVTKPVTTVPPNIDDLNNQAHSRSQTQAVPPATATVTNTTLAPQGSSDELSFSTLAPETTTARPSRSFDEPFGEPMDGNLQSSVIMHGSNSQSHRPNSEENHNSLSELSKEHRLDSFDGGTFAQPTHMTSVPNLQLDNVPVNSPSISPATTVLNITSHDSNLSTQGSSQVSPSTPAVENHSTNTSSREFSGDFLSNAQQQPRNVLEIPPQSQPIGRSGTTNQANVTSVSEKKVQLLKPRVKFRCSQPSDCQNGALCHNGMCFCSPGFTGDSCDVNIDECRQHGGQPCLNGGICIDSINEFKCECAPGFRGDRCQDLADMCNDSPCLNNATCNNHRTNYTCTCKPGWEGHHCELNIDDCAKSPCQNGANCQDLVDSYKCECAQGFTGANCEINVDDCASNSCQNNATCRDLVNDYECECTPGFVGKNCEENIDECASSPCSPHGECTDLINSFKCDCHDGWTGKQCEDDINECESNRPVCHHGATCVNLDGSYQCNCRDGYTGRKCSDISDFCKAKQPCGKNGLCKNLGSSKNSFQCECYSGYVGNRCERKRNCDSHECSSEHSHCVNNITCACLPGRREERIMCEYVSSCEQVEGELCLHNGLCKNLETGGYHCACQDPWYGPVCQFRAESQLDAILLVVITCVGFLIAACAVVSLVIFRSVRKARATRGTYSPSTQEKFGNSASDLLKPPIPERLI